jgi:hypothetical protein
MSDDTPSPLNNVITIDDERIKSHSRREQLRRPAGAAVDHIGDGGQSQSRQGARHYNSDRNPAARRRGDRMKRRQARCPRRGQASREHKLRRVRAIMVYARAHRRHPCSPLHRRQPRRECLPATACGGPDLACSNTPWKETHRAANPPGNYDSMFAGVISIDNG